MSISRCEYSLLLAAECGEAGADGKGASLDGFLGGRGRSCGVNETESDRDANSRFRKTSAEGGSSVDLGGRHVR